MQKDEFQKKLLEEALEAGFTDGEFYYQGSKSTQVMVTSGEIAQYENAVEQGVSFRGTYQGAMGYAYSEELSEEAIQFLLGQAKENAVLMEEEEKEVLFAGEKQYPKVEAFSEELSGLLPEQLIADALLMEKEAVQAGAAMVEYSMASYGEAELAIANTRGMQLSFRSNFAAAYLSVIAQRNGEVKTASDYWSGRVYKSFSPAALAQRAAAEAIRHLGAKSQKSGVYPVVLKDTVMISLLSTFLPIFFAENAQKGFSLLEGKEGEKIAANCVTIRDDGLYPESLSAIPFDSEGIKSQNKAVIENGILKTLLYNSKSAKKAGRASTGNGFKASFQAPVGTSGTVFYLQPGESTQESLFEGAEGGLYITEVAGLHAGANGISGDFSLSAEGFLLQKGQCGKPIEQITIAGNFYSLLSDILAAGNLLRFDASGAVGAPDVLLQGLQISGL